jgi:hypothetical protein
VIGVSRSGKKSGNLACRELRSNGYRIYHEMQIRRSDRAHDTRVETAAGLHTFGSEFGCVVTD